MGQLRVGPTHLVNRTRIELDQAAQVAENDILNLRNQITNLEFQLSQKEVEYVDVVKEVIKEVITEVKVIEEKIVEVIKHIEVIKEVPVEVIKEIVTEVKVIEEKIVEKVQEIEKFVHVTPKWVFGVMALETMLIILLLAIKL